MKIYIYEYENIDDKNYFIFVNNYFKQKKKKLSQNTLTNISNN